MDINTLYKKLESVIAFIKPSNNNDPNVIDLQQTFNSQNINVLPVIKKILNLPDNFPNNILHTKDGHKYNELEFFQSNLDSNITSIDNLVSFFQKFNKTQTKLGKHLLQSILLNPLHTPQDINNILLNRQLVIKNLIHSPNLTGIISRIKELNKLEQDILAMSIQDTPEMQEVYKIIFFEFKPLQGLNYNEIFQKIFCYFLIIFSPLYGVVSPFIFMFAPFILLRYVMKVPITFDIFWQIIKKMIFGGTGFFANLNKMFNSGIGSTVEGIINPEGGISVKSVVIWLAKLLVGFMNSSFGTYAYIGFIVISYIYGIYNSIQVSITYNKIINMFHSRLNIISTWLKECTNFYKMNVCLESNELIGIRNQIDILLTHPTIRNLLEHKTFTHEPGIISNKGIIIKTFKEFLDAKETMQKFIEPFSHYMAYIDVFTATSSWLREGFNQSRSFCNYLCENPTPLVKGTAVWNICCDKPIYNNIQLGGHNPNVALDSDLLENSSKLTVDNIKKHNEMKNANIEIKDKVQEEVPVVDEEVPVVDEEVPVVEEDVLVDAVEEVPAVEEEVPAVEEEVPAVEEEVPAVEEQLQKGAEKIEKRAEREWFNNMLITGPNSSGKSTYIKSIIECILLGQTIGVVPAAEFQLTPFKNITTYLNIPDCQGKESLFQAEMNRCHQQLEMLENAEKQKEFSFNIMDEIFVSTNYQEGMSGAYAVINQLCKFNKCINIITTHFDVLANMQELKVDKQYFDIEIDEKDNITKDYKIKTGVSKKHMALKLLKKKGFNADIIKDAEYLYEKIRNTK
jgi:nicotinamide riboside kinase